jgi:HAD superfamily hydrolase (TIGR01509 family)
MLLHPAPLERYYSRGAGCCTLLASGDPHSAMLIRMARFPRMDPPALALVIDLDGTLVDTFAAMQGAFSAAAGREVGVDELLTLFGPGAGTEAGILEQLGVPDAETLERWYEHYRTGHAELAPFPGMRETLEGARARGLRTGMLTGKGRRSTLITLDALGVTPLLDAIVTGDEAPAAKPDPSGLLLVLEQLGVAPARAVYIGDSLADAGAARAAGTRIAAALWDPRASILRYPEPPDYLLRSPVDLPALLDAIADGPAAQPLA